MGNELPWIECSERLPNEKECKLYTEQDGFQFLEAIVHVTSDYGHPVDFVREVNIPFPVDPVSFCLKYDAWMPIPEYHKKSSKVEVIECNRCHTKFVNWTLDGSHTLLCRDCFKKWRNVYDHLESYPKDMNLVQAFKNGEIDGSEYAD